MSRGAWVVTPCIPATDSWLKIPPSHRPARKIKLRSSALRRKQWKALDRKLLRDSLPRAPACQWCPGLRIRSSESKTPNASRGSSAIRYSSRQSREVAGKACGSWGNRTSYLPRGATPVLRRYMRLVTRAFISNGISSDRGISKFRSSATHTGIWCT